MGNNVAGIRRAQGVTQAELAKKAKVSRPYISLIESGKQQAISNIVMEKIATALNGNIEEIFLQVMLCQHNKKGARAYECDHD